MNDDVRIVAPQGYLTGFPVQVHVLKGAQEKPKAFVQKADGSSKYEITLSEQTGLYTGELLFSVPGDYQVVVGDFHRVIHVEPSKVLDFGMEFGIFSTAVIFILIGMIVWLKKRKGKWKNISNTPLNS